MEKGVIGLQVAVVALLAVIAGVLLRPLPAPPPINVDVSSPNVSVQPSEQLGNVIASAAMLSTSTGYHTTDTVIELASSSLGNSDIYAVRSGVLGSLHLIGPRVGTGVIEFFDTTTTDPTKRASDLPSSSIRIASIPTQNVTTSFPFNLVFQRGLWVVIRGTVPTSTITWR